VDKFDFESGAGSASPTLPPRTFAMAAGMNTCLRPILPPKVWDSGETFHPAAKELAAIREANMAQRHVGSAIPIRAKVKHEEVDAKGVEFDKKILSPAAFRKFEEAKATVKASGTGRFNARLWQVKGYDVKVIPLGTSSAVPSKYRNGRLPPFFPIHNKLDGYRFL
jgi:hypothetical protein